MREAIYKCPRCNSRLHDISTRNPNGKIIHYLFVCDYCKLSQESVHDDKVDPIVWKLEDGTWYDPNTKLGYLIDTEDYEDEETTILPALPAEADVPLI